MTLTISVRQSDIERGRKGDCHHCPIARALARALPPTIKPIKIQVGVGFLHFETSEHKRYSAPTPEQARNFIHDFDKEIEVKKIRFTAEFEELREF